MPSLIILRGPMGSGKSEVGGYLRGKLEDSAELNLDLNADSEVPYLDQVLGSCPHPLLQKITELP
jgi:hypothetical protein